MFNFALSLLGIFLVIVILKYCILKYLGVKNELKSLKENPIIDPVPTKTPQQWREPRRATKEEMAAKKSCFYCPFISACETKGSSGLYTALICNNFPS